MATFAQGMACNPFIENSAYANVLHSAVRSATRLPPIYNLWYRAPVHHILDDVVADRTIRKV